ncbi:fatty acid desaturase CarF family protein [Ovoidimarina sediminis]|uniref:fatty acid desaturase CarF family protein n=1 Tax=Ovoidimarina sediminis TaxID=3079856 RepID=UPI0029308CF9|nr:fatty acid desaturase CarF family protein [Rhodophyticola sp. MJ-SS7]
MFLLMFWLDALSWQVLTFICIGLLNQQVHRFSHTPQKRLPGVVRLLQRLRLIQDGRHHWVYHISPHSTRYCVLTPWMNPMLDRLGFWRCLERLFVPIFGAPRRNDLRVQPWYRPIAIWNCAN